MLPWLASKNLAPPLCFGRGTITTSPLSKVATLGPNNANLQNDTTAKALMMQVDPTALTVVMNQTLPLAMTQPLHSDTPEFNATAKFTRKRPFRPDPPPMPIRPTMEPRQLNWVHYLNYREDGRYKERRSSPQQNSAAKGPKTDDHPWSMQGYDCDDPRGLQDVIYARGEACIEKMKVRHVRNATIYVFQKLEYEKRTDLLFCRGDSSSPILRKFGPHDHV